MPETLCADAGRLGQILVNLIMNALQHAFRDGRRGTITLANGSVSFGNIDNNANATITGKGLITASDTFGNNGTLAPGGTGQIGTLTLNGGQYMA